mgnify:FL=1
MEKLHISVRGLSHVYFREGIPVPALDSIDLSVRKGSFVSVVGPSGGGKTTLLKCMGGLINQTEGKITIAGKPPEDAIRRRAVGYVFQDPSLLPWRTVLRNLELPLEIAGDSIDTEKSHAMLAAIGMSQFGDFYPHQLSGGMSQRVAFGRSLVMEPELLLMDEPLGALDEITRIDMRHHLLALWEDAQSTVVMVTHSIPEAIIMSDSVIVLSSRPGKVVDEVVIDLPRPREKSLEDTSEFHVYCARVKHLLLEAATIGSPDGR